LELSTSPIVPGQKDIRASRPAQNTTFTGASKLSLPSANAPAKARSVIAGMLAGADSIEDLDLLRSGGMARVVGGVRAPSTLGTFLRTFTHGHVQQIDKISAGLLAGLTGQVPGLLAGGRGADGLVFIDIDDTVRAVHGYHKQAAGFGYARVKGLNSQLSTISTPVCAPLLGRTRLRRGNIASAAGAPRLLAQSVATVRAAGLRGKVMTRADSAYFVSRFLTAAFGYDAWFSVTARMNPQVVKAIAAIDEDAWTPIKYPKAVWDDQVGGWVSDAQVAEVGFTAFTSLPKTQQVTCRLVVRRVKRRQPRASDGSVQGELFEHWRHHAFVTNSTRTTLEADERHRDHASSQVTHPQDRSTQDNRGQVRQRSVLELGDDLLDDRVVAVGGLGREHRLTGVGEHRVVTPHREQLVPAGRDSRRVVGWQLSTSLRTDLALDALEMGIWTRERAGRDVAGMTHHSDKGVQGVAVRYTQRLAEAGVVASVGSTGDCDNALAEAFNSLFKA
jgi:hypothetical protein